MFICNFVPVERKNYKIGVPCLTKYEEILSSDEERFGGFGRNNKKKFEAVKEPCDREQYSIVMDVPPLSVTVLKYDFEDETKPAKKKTVAKKTATKKAKPAAKKTSTKKK